MITWLGYRSTTFGNHMQTRMLIVYKNTGDAKLPQSARPGEARVGAAGAQP